MSVNWQKNIIVSRSSVDNLNYELSKATSLIGKLRDKKVYLIEAKGTNIFKTMTDSEAKKLSMPKTRLTKEKFQEFKEAIDGRKYDLPYDYNFKTKAHSYTLQSLQVNSAGVTQKQVDRLDRLAKKYKFTNEIKAPQLGLDSLVEKTEKAAKLVQQRVAKYKAKPGLEKIEFSAKEEMHNGVTTKKTMATFQSTAKSYDARILGRGNFKEQVLIDTEDKVVVGAPLIKTKEAQAKTPEELKKLDKAALKEQKTTELKEQINWLNEIKINKYLAKLKLPNVLAGKIVEIISPTSKVSGASQFGIATPLAKGGNLNEAMLKGVPVIINGEELAIELDDNLIKQIFHDLARGLKGLHDAGIVHRDLKPDNIFIDYKVDSQNHCTLEFFISDFGLSSFQDEHKRNEILEMFPIRYMAPETFYEDNKFVSTSEMGSLGVLFYSIATSSALGNIAEGIRNVDFYQINSKLGLKPLLTGQLDENLQNPDPAALNTWKKIPSDVKQRIADKWSTIPPDIQELILKMIELDPSKKLASLDSIIQKFESAKDHVYTATSPNVKPDQRAQLERAYSRLETGALKRQNARLNINVPNQYFNQNPDEIKPTSLADGNEGNYEVLAPGQEDIYKAMQAEEEEDAQTSENT